MSQEVVIMRFAALVLILGLASPAYSLGDKPKKEKKEKGADVHVSVVFQDDERERVRSYFVEKHGRGNCPPGLAKKGNGCLPPGQAKKRYAVGRPLPPDIVIEEVPPDLIVRIGRPAPGYRYAIVDGDVVKLVVGTMLVVDAIDNLVSN